jgi:hypothetical protein
MDLATFDALLLLIAFILFLLAAFNVAIKHVNPIALGLAVWVLVVLIDAWNAIT